jgi:hypothetical protein
MCLVWPTMAMKRILQSGRGFAATERLLEKRGAWRTNEVISQAG